MKTKPARKAKITERIGVFWCDIKTSESKTEKGYISLGMSKRMSKRISQGSGLGYYLWGSSLVDNFSLTHLSLVNSKKDILLDIPRDICILSWFSAQLTVTLNERTAGGRKDKVIYRDRFAL